MYKDKCFNILIVGDSRVIYLYSHLSTSTLNLNIHVECLPGVGSGELHIMFG